MKRIVRGRLLGLFLLGLLVELILSLSLGTTFGQSPSPSQKCPPGEGLFPDGNCHRAGDSQGGYDPPLQGVAKQCWQDSDCSTGEICEKAGRPSGQPGGCVGGVVHVVPKICPLTPHPKSQ